jgi:hypothetical protein
MGDVPGAGQRVAVVTGGAGAIGGALTGQTLCVDGGLVLR